MEQFQNHHLISRSEKKKKSNTKNLRTQMYRTDTKYKTFYKSSKDHVYFSQDVKDNRGVIKCTGMSENNNKT